TRACAHLRMLDDGLFWEGQAVLAASLRAHWSDAARHAVAGLFGRLAARQLGKTSYVIRVRIEKGAEKSLTKLEATLGVRLLSPLAGSGAEDVPLLVPQANLNA